MLLQFLFIVMFSLSFSCTAVFASGIEEDLFSKKNKIKYLSNSQPFLTNSGMKNDCSSENKKSLVVLPNEINSYILNYLDLTSILYLKHSCKYFNNLINNDWLYNRIPPKIISFFPPHTSAVCIILGEQFFNNGLKRNSKKLMRKAAELHHQKALHWLENRKNSKVSYESRYISSWTFFPLYTGMGCFPVFYGMPYG